MEMDSKRRWEPGNNKIENKQRKMMGGRRKNGGGLSPAQRAPPLAWRPERDAPPNGRKMNRAEK